MKLKKLDIKGFSHHLLAVVVVLTVAIGGTAYLVASHADSCNPVSGSATSGSATSGSATSGSVTSGSSTTCPVSDPNSSPVSVSRLSAYCVIKDISPYPKYNNKIRPEVLFTNSNSDSFIPVLSETNGLTSAAGQNQVVSSETITFRALKAGNNVHRFLPTYTVPYASSFNKGYYTVTNVPNTVPTFSCTVTFQLPIKPTT